jgi:hypothetical protein
MKCEHGEPRWYRDQQLTGCKTSGYDDDDDESLLGYSAVQSQVVLRWRCVLPLSSTITSNGNVIVDGKLENMGKFLSSILMYYSSTCQTKIRKYPVRTADLRPKTQTRDLCGPKYVYIFWLITFTLYGHY